MLLRISAAALICAYASATGFAQDCDTCCRPNRTKIVNRYSRSVFAGGAAVPAPPPAGFAVQTVPAVNLAASPFVFGAGFSTAGVVPISAAGLTVQPAATAATQETIQSAVAAAVKEAMANRAPRAAAAAASDCCDDHEAELAELRQAVRDLTAQTRELSAAMRVLAEERQKAAGQ